MAEERKSHLKEIVVAVVVALLVGSSAPWWWQALFGDDGGANGNDDGTPVVSLSCRDPALSLSRGTGPSGTAVVVRGSGFPSDESVGLRFHTEALPPARTDADGAFEVEVVIPGTFDVFAPQRFDIRASTSPTICSESTPFELTR